MPKVQTVVARLTLIVEYEELPDEDDLTRLVDEARSYGHPVKADFEILKLVKRDLLTA